ncbi:MULTISPECIES: DUF3515 domain-containing protein [unclassified Brevibacterium]|uniref:DUF3515 domain-containing protein n=1 Tax=unclassified Brevibacterium TaxID=2614124 RepID=UPI0010816F72|nr:DUF3515 domain-containing protein [Brevibacterium sp. S111]TGD11350.1 DUF3515 domain-containing protein [Brevibacterium sp. S111]
MRSRSASPRRVSQSPRRASRSPHRPRSLALAAVAAVLVGVALSGCAHKVIVEPAKDAANPKCADIMLTLPDEISGQKARTTSSQGTKAWGDPNIAVLRCGVTPPGPTTDQCVSVSGVDWISKPSDDDDDATWMFTSYGRKPAVEVLVNRKAESGNDVLAAVSPALAKLEPEAECVGAEDVED